MRTTQNKRIIEYLKTGKTLTSIEAQEKLGVARFASRVNELRDAGYIIGDKWEYSKNRYGEDVRYKRYFLLGGNAFDVQSSISG